MTTPNINPPPSAHLIRAHHRDSIVIRTLVEQRAKHNMTCAKQIREFIEYVHEHGYQDNPRAAY